jgi:hypothetical protein
LALAALGVFADETDEMDCIQIHEIFSFSARCDGVTKGGVDTAPKARGCILGGTRRFGRNRKSRSPEAAGRRNYPEAVPRREGGKED